MQWRAAFRLMNLPVTVERISQDVKYAITGITVIVRFVALVKCELTLLAQSRQDRSIAEGPMLREGPTLHSSLPKSFHLVPQLPRFTQQGLNLFSLGNKRSV